MMLKVCGMREPDNINEIASVQPDMLGLIFYPKSKRYVKGLDTAVARRVSSAGIKTVGVFVNAGFEEIIETARDYGLDYIQLHGDESLELGKRLHAQKLKLIKVFRIDRSLPKEEMDRWSAITSFFLFDTMTNAYGGSGKQFDWQALVSYHLNVPFLLSGGIGSEDVADIMRLDVPMLAGIDINSRVESAPGMKNVEMVRAVKQQIC